MEQIENAITQLTGAVNAQVEQMRVMSARINQLEAVVSPPNEMVNYSNPINLTEADLREINRLPDSVKTLPTFEGDPVQFISWVHNVESTLKDYDVVKTKPIYRAILRQIRQKIKGPADTALISYNIFDEDWGRIKSCLSLHYADKRDLRTLEHELGLLSQKHFSVDQFYARINHQLSLIVNKIKGQDYSRETCNALLETYRNRALDVFIRGLSAELSRMLVIQRPKNLPEAYSFCLEIQNLNLRNYSIYPKNTTTPIQASRYQIKQKQYFVPKGLGPAERNQIYNRNLETQIPPPPRPTQPKPPVPMEVDPSIHSKRVNYMNRIGSTPVVRQSNNSSNIPWESQKLFNVQTEDQEPETLEDGRLSSLPYLELIVQNGNTLKFLIDTGANKNFACKKIAKNSLKLKNPFKVQSSAGQVGITHKLSGPFFKSIGIKNNFDFFILPNLKSFDGIIGDDTLKQLEAIINRKDDTLTIRGIVLPLKHKVSKQVNNLVETLCKYEVEKIIDKYADIFGPVSDSGTIDTTVLAEIRTTTEEPIYTKSYPYPANLRGEVEKQITELINNGIIRPSKSPYNSPLWIVPKKPSPSKEKKYRVVVDFKRLNSVTIPDAYPIPDINSTLASLGECKYFTTLDLTSGFHQIRMRERDIEKTAFSTANGKYEFTRLPFGLKNAPSIFQRMINDVLKPLIGISCYVYIDDIIILGKTKEEHLRNIEDVFALLHQANLKVNLEKSKFFRTRVEFLGHIVTGNGILPDPEKISAIKNIVAPVNLKELKSFLGLASYYRRFIQDFAKIAKPLTNLTRGENAQIKASQSKKIKVSLTDEGLKSFNDLKTLLMSSEILAFPDFNKSFILTTDASNTAIGAVLSQGEIGKDKPITYISRSLNKTEENYSTIEKEMLAIVWSLDKLRIYLYGAKDIKILTDHQPLTFALSNSNNNAKLKRWKARIEEYNYKLFYKPGKTNVVADALSRLPIEINSLTSSTPNSQHSAAEDSSQLIPHCEAPLNVFKNQIIFEEGKDEIINEEPHPRYHRHRIKREIYDKEIFVKTLKDYLNPNIINGIKIPEKYIALLQQVYQEGFSKFRARITQKFVTDIPDEEVKFKIIEREHRRAHRNDRENKEQILEKYYFPQMSKFIKKYTKSCKTCGYNKYDRHPQKPELQATPIPSYPTEILHIDIIEMSGEKFISCIDKFSKFVKFFKIKNKSVLHIRDKLIKVLHYFTAPKTLVMDNEGSFISPITLNYLESLGIEIYLAPPQKSEVNGAIERVHSTIIEIVRCLQSEYPDCSLKEIVNIAVDRYNNTIHSVTKKKPADIFFGRTQRINYQDLTNFRDIVNVDLRNEIARKQKNMLKTHNRKRSKPKKYVSGEIVLKKDKQIKSKTKPIFKNETVAKDNDVTITTTNNRKIHKSHLKN